MPSLLFTLFIFFLLYLLLTGGGWLALGLILLVGLFKD